MVYINRCNNKLALRIFYFVDRRLLNTVRKTTFLELSHLRKSSKDEVNSLIVSLVTT